MSRLRVLYLAGSGRSGSTIVDNCLGEVAGLVSVGELRFLWDRNVRDDRICGCGQPFSQCPQWRKVLRRAYGTSPPTPAWMLEWRERAMPLRAAPLVALPGVRRRLKNHHAPYLEVLERLYHAVAEVFGARVVVDSSKYPSYGYLLSLIDSLDVRVVHLVRDPRAVAYSWTRHKEETTSQGVQVPMGQVAPSRTAVDWMLWSILAEGYGRAGTSPTLRMRYEDFVASPREALVDLLGHVGIVGEALPFLSERGLQLSGNHTVGGNPSRLRSGPVQLRLDDEWRGALSTRHRRQVTAVAWPAMLAYGYPRGGS